jgi:hypothetical protein
MEMSPRPAHLLYKETHMGFFDDAISTIGRGLAQTAVKAASDATGVDVGGTINFLFGNGQTEGGQALAQLQTAVAGANLPPDQIDSLQAALTQQGATITGIGTQLDAISQTLSTFQQDFAHIEALLSGIKQQGLYNTWESVDIQLKVYLAAISTAYTRYGNYTADALGGTPVESGLVTDLVTDILDVNVGPEVGLTAISTFILGGGQTQGGLRLWSEMVTPLVLDQILDYRSAVQQYMEYYKKLAYAQLCATNLLMEAYNFNGDAPLATQAWQNYKAILASQEETFIQWLIPLIAAGAINYNSFPTYTAVHAALQLDPSVQQLTTKGFPYYEPSPVFEAAEALLASLSLTSSEDRRVVVYIVYLGYAPISSLVSAAQLTLSTSSGAPLSSSSNATFGPFSYGNIDSNNQTTPDDNFPLGSPFFVKRFVYAFSDGAPLADGGYTLTNLNGVNGLIPMQTYLGTAPFMSDVIVNYGLFVDPAEPFDFMNFMAYSLPVINVGGFSAQ